MAELPCLTVQNATVTFGEKPLFKDLTVRINSGMRATLIGRNGCGKSTLLKTLAGLVELDEGKRFVQPGYRVSYLPQDVVAQDEVSALNFVLSASTQNHPLETFQAESWLDQLKIPTTKMMNQMSGGEQRRAALAKAMVVEPHVLLLDEPTNHLDVGTIEWLEEELRAFRGGLVTISHDRRFLEKVTQHMFWMDRGQLFETARGYKAFDEWSEMLLEQEARAMDKLDKLLAEEIQWLHKGVTARRKRNQGRLGRLHQLREKRRTHEGAKGKAILPPPTPETESRLVLEAQGLSKTFEQPTGKLTILRDFSFRVLKGDRLGIVGNNGTGKSTFINMLLGELPPDTGRIRYAPNLNIASCSQTHDLNPKKTLWETLCETGGDQVNVQGNPRHVVSYLKDFLFSDQQARHLVGTLSGGERNRLMLAKALAQPSSMLILDEPTNDLDMDTLDVLEDILGEYTGTLILVSHDRDFIDRLVTSTLVFEGNGVVGEYVGGYSDYLKCRGDTQKQTSSKSTKKSSGVEKKTPEKPATDKKRLSYKFQREQEECELLFEEGRLACQKIETQLNDSNLFLTNPTLFQTLSDQLGAWKTKISNAELRWLEIEDMKE